MISVFIYTFKASSIKFFAVVLLSVTVLVGLITVLPEYGSAGDVAVVAINYGDVKTAEDRLNFIKQFGYEVSEEPLDSSEILIPEKFDSVYEKYNELQRAQGLNLKKFQGKNVTKYTFQINNYANYDGKVYFTLLVSKDKVIAGDICGLGDNKFVHGFEMPPQN